MRIAIIGSRSLSFSSFENYVTPHDEIISGGASGIDTCAMNYAKSKGIPFIEIKPDYKKYGRAAPIVRNKEIVSLADKIIAIWDGKSKGTLFVINYATKLGKDCEVILIS